MHSFLLLSRFSHAGLRPLALAVLGTLSVGTVYAATGYDATHPWDDSDVPTVENGTISFASKDIAPKSDKVGLLVGQKASGTIENLELIVNGIGPKDGTNQDPQIYGIEIITADTVVFAGERLSSNVTTNFVGGGNNQASAFDFYAAGTANVTASTVDLRVTSTATNGKSVYGIGVGGGGTVNITSDALNIKLETATDRQNATGDNIYSEAIGIDVYKGQLNIAQNTVTKINVTSKGETVPSGADIRTGGSPATGLKLEGGQAKIDGALDITVSAEGGNAAGVAVTNYFYNTSMGHNYASSAGELGDVTAHVSSSNGSAYGLYTEYTKGTDEYEVILKVDGSSDLTATAVDGKASAIAVDGKTTVALLGNVTAKAEATGKGTANSVEVQDGQLNLKGTQNTLVGDVSLKGQSTVQFGSTEGTSATSLMGDLSADATSNFNLTNHTVTLSEGNVVTMSGTLSGENGTIVYDTDKEGAVNIAKNSAKNLQVRASGRLNDLYGSADELLKAGHVSVTNDSAVEEAGYTQGAEAGTVTGAWTVDNEGVVHQEANYSMAAFQAFNNATLVQWRNEVNHLSQRLGDVRSNLRTAGAWARIYGGDSTIKKDVTTDIRSTTVQVGADATAGGNWILGGAFSYTDMNADISNGEGDSDGYTLAVYASGFFDCGGYVDLVGRLGRLSTDLRASNLSSAADFDGSYDNTAFGVSAEIGYHWALSQTFFVEPQAEFAYGYVLGDDFKASNGVKIEQDDFQTLVGRLGARLGANFPKDAGNFYVHASINHEFLGDTDFDATPSAGQKRSFDSSVDGTWISYGVGMQLHATEALSLYGALERSHGDDYNDSFRYSVGGRLIW